MMRGLPATIWPDRAGTAAAEMAMVTPLLVILMFGSLELGKYFLDEHVVVKAVRDGARFAARQNFSSMPCEGAPTNAEQIRNQVRYGKPVVTDADQPRLYYWTESETITITISCYDNSGDDGARVYDGIYTARPFVPRVTVAASVPYVPLVGAIGFQAGGLKLNASNQATVSGL